MANQDFKRQQRQWELCLRIAQLTLEIIAKSEERTSDE